MTMEKKIVIIASPNGAEKTTFEGALQTNTPLVFMRDGVLVEEFVTDAAPSDIGKDDGKGTTKL